MAEQVRLLNIRINELEQENADLQHKVDTLQGFLDNDIEYDMDKTIQELRKENTELKSELTKKADTNHSLVEQMSKQNEQLEQAKKIIKELVDRLNGFVGHHFYIVDEAEQFLKGE